MTQTYDVNVKEFKPLISPGAIQGRKNVADILTGKDKRMLVIAGPCSIHDSDAALEYARKMTELRHMVKDKIDLIMRVYFEKPRTTVGWKGMINDPFLDSTYNVNEGLKKARKLLLDINDMGLPTVTELLDPITPQYIAGLLTWVAIGARTTESQTHREMASGLSMPVGFKNSTDGSLDSAINAMQASQAPQHFLGIDPNGYASVVKTTGNPYGHIVLRGGPSPNYDPVSVGKVQEKLKAKDLLESVMIDCSHDNSGQKFKGQSFVFKSAIDQRVDGSDNIIGLMLESNLCEGSQKCDGNIDELEYGVSITDECISWETTEGLIRCANEKLPQL